MMKIALVALTSLFLLPPVYAAELEDQIAQARKQLDAAARQLAELHKQKFVWAEDGDHERAMLGVLLGDMEQQERADGVELYGVTPGGGADAAGLKAGDLITKIDAVSLAEADDPLKALTGYMKNVEPGESVTVEYVRDGEALSASIATQARSAHVMRFIDGNDFDFDFDFNFDEFTNGADFTALIPNIRTGAERSPHLMAVEGDLARYFDVEEGVVVVSPPTENSELKGGDVILSVGDKTIDDLEEAERRLAAIEGVATVDVKRSGKRRSVEVEQGEFDAHRIKVIHIERKTSGVDPDVEIRIDD
jgi:S1-C subfamily serine protease